VAHIEPVIEILFVPKARLPPDTVNPPVAVATVILAVPSKDTQPIVLAFCKAVAVAALPVVEPDDHETLPVTLPVRLAATVVVVSVPVEGLNVNLVDDTF
jgi:hypothetical protein